MIIKLIGVFSASLVYIGLKALQQRQVMSAEYKKMPMISMGMAFCEVLIMGNIAVTSVNEGLLSAFWLAVALGLGGGAGSMLGTWFHERRGTGND